MALVLAACGGTAAAPQSSSASSAPSASSATATTLASVIDGARKEGKLVLVWGGGAVGASDGAKLLAEGINKQYGLTLDVEFSLGPSMPDMSAKILQEYQSQRASSSDVLLGSEAHFPPLMKAGALEAVDWAKWSDNIKDPALLGYSDGTSVKVATRTAGITYNTRNIQGDAIPKSMQDLLKPQYKGQIASTPYAAMFDRLASDDWWGLTKTVDYVTKLSTQVAGLVRCGETQRISSGEFNLFALDCGANDALRGKAQGGQLDQVIPSDAAAMVYWYMGVPKNAAHPNAAKLFINYLLGRQGQDAMWQTSWDDLHLVTGAHTAGPIDQLKAQGVVFKQIDIDYQIKHDDAKAAKIRQQLQDILAKKS